jgi:hypothetical protein
VNLPSRKANNAVKSICRMENANTFFGAEIPLADTPPSLDATACCATQRRHRGQYLPR